MRCSKVLVLVALLAAGTFPVAAETLALHVSPKGNDAWSGRLDFPNPAGTDGPLTTIAGARDTVRKLRQQPGGLAGPVRVLIHGGEYFIAEPIVFTPEDSGTADATIAYEAAPEEPRPVIHSGRRITGWTEDNGRWVAELPDVANGNWDFGALWVNGARRMPARTPNAAHPFGDYPEKSDFFYMDGAVMVPDGKGGEAKSASSLKCREGDIKPWAGLDDAIFVVFHSWETSLHRVKSYDEGKRTVEFTGAAPWCFTYWNQDQRYYVENLLEGLDQPGEWCLRRREGKVYYMPMPGETLDNTQIIAPVARQLVLLKGRPAEGAFIDHLAFRGLDLRYAGETIEPQGHADSQAEATLPASFECVGARNCVIEDCFIGHIGNYGVWFRTGCQNNVMRHSELCDLGGGAVRMGEAGNPASDNEISGGNTVDNCFLHEGGLIYRGAIGVWIGRSSNNTVSHNEICDFRYSGMSIGWSWGYDPSSANHNIAEYNHIHDVGKGQLSDMGGIYTLGISPGTVLRNNYIHDIISNPAVSCGWGMYTDEGSTDVLLENNVVINTRSGGFHQHYGKENRIVNNIFALSHNEQIIRSRQEEHTSFFFERNIVYYNNGRLLGSAWSNGKYAMDNNLYWDASGQDVEFAGKSLAEWQAAGFDQHSVVADPLFVDPEHRDYRLKPESPALALGFKPIDVGEAGLYGDTVWTDKPKKVTRIAAPMPKPSDPVKISLNFDDLPVDALCPGAQTAGETETARIRVAQCADPGHGKVLRFTDVPGLSHAYDPHLIFSPGLRSGKTGAKFSAKLSPGAYLYHEWRDGHDPYRVGPGVFFQPDGKIMAVGGREVGAWKPGEWMDVEITCGLGKAATGQWSLSVVLPGRDPVRLEGLSCGSPEFQRLDWFGFVSDATDTSEIFLDSVELRQ
jgi:hypothetical protein